MIRLLLPVLLLAGCVAYEPVPTASAYERAWNAALGAVQEAGVQIASADPATGQIRGGKDGIDVIVGVARQANGGARVQFDAKGPTQRDPELSDRFSRAYERRMGRS